MKKLSTVLIEQIRNLTDKKEALYILKELLEKEWDNLSIEDQELLENEIDNLKKGI